MEDESVIRICSLGHYLICSKKGRVYYFMGKSQPSTQHNNEVIEFASQPFIKQKIKNSQSFHITQQRDNKWSCAITYDDKIVTLNSISKGIFNDKIAYLEANGPKILFLNLNKSTKFYGDPEWLGGDRVHYDLNQKILRCFNGQTEVSAIHIHCFDLAEFFQDCTIEREIDGMTVFLDMPERKVRVFRDTNEIFTSKRFTIKFIASIASIEFLLNQLDLKVVLNETLKLEANGVQFIATQN